MKAARTIPLLLALLEIGRAHVWTPVTL